MCKFDSLQCMLTQTIHNSLSKVKEKFSKLLFAYKMKHLCSIVIHGVIQLSRFVNLSVLDIKHDHSGSFFLSGLEVKV